jgi:hypothetical protein
VAAVLSNRVSERIRVPHRRSSCWPPPSPPTSSPPSGGVGHHRPAGGDGGPCGHLVPGRDPDRLAAVPRGRWSGSVSPAPSSPPRRWRHWPISCSAWSGGGGVAAGHGAGPHRPGGGVLGARAPRGHGRSGTILEARPASTTRVDRISGEASVMIACLASILPSQLDRLIALAGLGRPGGWVRRPGGGLGGSGGRLNGLVAAASAQTSPPAWRPAGRPAPRSAARRCRTPGPGRRGRRYGCAGRRRAQRTLRRGPTTPRGRATQGRPHRVVLQLALIGVVGGPSRRCSSRGSAGQASSRTERGTLRAA